MDVTQTTITPFPLLVPRMGDRQMVHALIMKALPDALDTNSPRSDAKALWHWDPAQRLLRVQAARPFRAELLGEVLAQESTVDPEADATVDLRLDVAVLKTPPSQVPEEIRAVVKEHGGAYRSRQVIVPAEERASWAARRLERGGFVAAPETLALSDVAFADLGRRGGRIAYVSLSATARVADVEAAHRAVIDGIGKGKNFGLGLVRIRPAASSSTTPPLPKETTA